VKDTTTALASPTLAARGAIQRVDDRGGGTRQVIRSPYHFSDAQSGVAGPAPRRGEHNAEVLAQWLGMSEADAASLAEQGVLLVESARPEQRVRN
jgi:formyl-CoA transferase